MAPGDLGYSFVPFLASPFERPATTRFLEPRGRGGRTFRRAASAACPHPPSRPSPLRVGCPPVGSGEPRRPPHFAIRWRRHRRDQRRTREPAYTSPHLIGEVSSVPENRHTPTHASSDDHTQSYRIETPPPPPPEVGTGEASLVPKADRAMGSVLYTGSILGFFAIGERWDRVPITMPSKAAP